jgi:hypothetical protein
LERDPIFPFDGQVPHEETEERKMVLKENETHSGVAVSMLFSMDKKLQDAHEKIDRLTEMIDALMKERSESCERCKRSEKQGKLE